MNFAYLTDLELWLPLDEGQGTIAEDASGNDRDTNLNGGSWGPGQIAGGLQFDGNDYLSTGGVDLSQWLGGTATMAFWINTTQVGNNTAWQAPGISGLEVAGGANDVFGDGSTLREAFGSRRQTVRRRRVAFLSMTATGTISLCNETRATELSEFLSTV